MLFKERNLNSTVIKTATFYYANQSYIIGITLTLMVLMTSEIKNLH